MLDTRRQSSGIRWLALVVGVVGFAVHAFQTYRDYYPMTQPERPAPVSFAGKTSWNGRGVIGTMRMPTGGFTIALRPVHTELQFKTNACLMVWEPARPGKIRIEGTRPPVMVWVPLQVAPLVW